MKPKSFAGDDLEKRLAASKFRSRFKLGDDDLIYIARHGWEAIARQAGKFVVERLAPAEPANDGRQTPMKGHCVFIAQHATGCCCRGCLEKWYGIPRGRALSGDEIDCLVDVLLWWLRRRATDERLAGLPYQPGLDFAD